MDWGGSHRGPETTQGQNAETETVAITSSKQVSLGSGPGSRKKPVIPWPKILPASPLSLYPRVSDSGFREKLNILPLGSSLSLDFRYAHLQF